MLLLDIMLNVYYLLIGFLVLAFCFVVIPYAIQLIIEEISIARQKARFVGHSGRHRGGRIDVARHRRVAHG